MPIVLPKDLPARDLLSAEGVDVVTPGQSPRGRRPALQIAVLNLMPEKAVTETQIARLLGDTAHLVELTLFVPDSYRPKTTSPSHMTAFYRRWSQIRRRRFDGLIVTGAPVETLPFAEVTYWPELTQIFDWAQQYAGQAFYICWAAQAALQHYHGVPKRALSEKMFGIFAHRNAAPDSPILCGLGDPFPMPVSRHTEVAAADLPVGRGLRILARADDSGLGLIHDPANRAYYMFNHLEYDAGTLAGEYDRDRRAGRPVPLPRNYFPGDDPTLSPAQTWRGTARILFRNWLDEVQLHAAARSGAGLAVDWLLRDQKDAARRGAQTIDFRIAVADARNAVPDVLHALAAFGLSPSALRVKEAAGGERIVSLGIAGGLAGRISGKFGAAGRSQAEEIARGILRRTATARRVAYRDSAGDGGILVAGRCNGFAQVETLAPPPSLQPPSRSAA